MSDEKTTRGPSTTWFVVTLVSLFLLITSGLGAPVPPLLSAAVFVFAFFMYLRSRR
jgi:hypothetical protein